MLVNAAWVGGSRLVVRCLGLLSTVILARLLSPEDFGLVAVSTAIIALVQGLTPVSFQPALIYYNTLDEEDYSTAWTLSMLRGLVLGMTVALAAPVLANIADDPRTQSIALVLALLPVISGAENPRFVDYQKALRFGEVFRLETTTKFAGVAVSIGTAIVFQSYWALIAGMFATHITRTLLTFVLAPRPSSLSVSRWKKLLQFSGWVAAGRALNVLSVRLQPIILGAYLDVQVVGTFHMARELTANMLEELAPTLRRVLFPTMSSLERGSNAYRFAYRQSIAGLTMIIIPLAAGLALVAPHVVPLLLGAQWMDAIFPLQLFALTLVVAAPGQLGASAAMAAGKTRFMFIRAAIVTPVQLTAFVLGTMKFGLLGAVGGSILGLLVAAWVTMTLGARFAGLSLLEHYSVSWRSWLALAAMTLWHAAVAPRISSLPSVLALLVAVSSCAAVYTGLHLLLWCSAGRPVGPESALVNAVRIRSRAA